MDNNISVNLRKNEITIKLNEKSSQEEILEGLKKRMPHLKKLYQDEETPIKITGKILENKEIDEIQELIKKHLNVKINFDSPRTLGLSEITKTYNRCLDVCDTKYHKGSIRSGQRIEYEGSIVIIGDVNDGGEVIASGNIIVVGNLRGLAHAGAKGNKDAIIAASSIETFQIRIANVVKEIDRDEVITEEKRKYASMQDEKIIIE